MRSPPSFSCPRDCGRHTDSEDCRTPSSLHFQTEHCISWRGRIRPRTCGQTRTGLGSHLNYSGGPMHFIDVTRSPGCIARKAERLSRLQRHALNCVGSIKMNHNPPSTHCPCIDHAPCRAGGHAPGCERRAPRYRSGPPGVSAAVDPAIGRVNHCRTHRQLHLSHVSSSPASLCARERSQASFECAATGTTARTGFLASCSMQLQEGDFAPSDHGRPDAPFGCVVHAVLKQ